MHLNLDVYSLFFNENYLTHVRKGMSIIELYQTKSDEK